MYSSQTQETRFQRGSNKCALVARAIMSIVLAENGSPQLLHTTTETPMFEEGPFCMFAASMLVAELVFGINKRVKCLKRIDRKHQAEKKIPKMLRSI